MVGTLKAQLEQHGMTHRLDEVLEETGRVREELGWPVMATPLSQLVGHPGGAQRGHRRALRARARRGRRLRGRPLRRAAGADRRRRRWSGSWPAENAERVLASPPEQPTLEELRARHGTGPGEDDLLILRALIPESDIAAMQAAGPVARDYPLLAPEIAEITSLIETVKTPYVRVANERWALDLKR